jgi:hypothetical protein
MHRTVTVREGERSSPEARGFSKTLGILDAPPESVIGRRGAPTRWRGMTGLRSGATEERAAPYLPIISRNSVFSTLP